jgi:hypothetical protein
MRDPLSRAARRPTQNITAAPHEYFYQTGIGNESGCSTNFFWSPTRSKHSSHAKF